MSVTPLIFTAHNLKLKSVALGGQRVPALQPLSWPKLSTFTIER